MKWTKEMEDAARLLGLDPEKERQRLRKPKRGRPKGSVVWTEDHLMALAAVVDEIKRRYKAAGERLTDEQILGWFRKNSDIPLPSPGTLRNVLTKARRLKPSRVVRVFFEPTNPKSPLND